MNDDESIPTRKGTRKGLKIALVSAGIAAGAIGATALGAGAATTNGTASAAASSSSTSSASSATTPPGNPGTRPMGGPMGGPMGHGGSAPVRGDEKSVDAATEATLKAAALKAVPGGTVIRVETDAGDAAYEAHMTKSDGTDVTVKFDKNLKEIKVETGMGQGDPAPAGAPSGAPTGH